MQAFNILIVNGVYNMELQIDFEYGPISAEIECDSSEEYDKVLDDLAAFIEDHKVLLNHSASSSDTSADMENGADVSKNGDSSSNGDSKWSSLVKKISVPEDKLVHIFGVGESSPQILVGDQIEGSKNQQMEDGALMLLTVLEHYYDEDNLSVTEISNCLKNSGLPSDNFSNVYQRDSFSKYFVREETSRSEGGTTSVIKLTPPGRKQAYDLIEDLASEIEV